jgi:hypothetical protein
MTVLFPTPLTNKFPNPAKPSLMRLCIDPPRLTCSRSCQRKLIGGFTTNRPFALGKSVFY